MPHPFQDPAVGFAYDSAVPFDNPQPYNPAVQAPPPPVSVPHLMIPVSLLPDGSFATVEQDSVPDVTQSVEVLCGSVQGQRSVIPSYGLPQTNFAPIDPQTIISAAQIWEPRANLQVTSTPDPDGQNNVNVAVSVLRGSSL